MEHFFIKGFVCWRYECVQQEYEARWRNWIWLDKFTSYVIIDIYIYYDDFIKHPCFNNCPPSHKCPPQINC